MFDKPSRLSRTDLLVVKIVMAWGCWLALGLVVWVFFPLSSDPTSHGFESFAVLVFVIAAQLPFAFIFLITAVRKWGKISEDTKFLSCSVFVLTLAAAGLITWYFLWW